METSNCALSFFSSAFLWIVLFLSRGSLAQPAADYLLAIHTELEFEAVSVPATGGGAAERVTKWLVPAKDDPKLLSSLFQNVARYPFHYEFLAAVFPDRFPGFTFDEYLDLVERRATRSYFAGVFFRLSGNPEKLYGFDVFTADADPSELPQVDEVRWAFQHLSAVFSLGPIAYSPRDPQAIKNAQSWVQPGFPIDFAFGGGLPDYIPYTLSENYGRVRILDQKQLAQANDTGEINAQNIIVLDVAPTDIEGVIAGVVTGTIQGELSHLSIRTARRGTPNAYVREAAMVLSLWLGKLVHFVVRADRYQISEATLPEAEAWWGTHRPKPVEVFDVDPAYDGFDVEGKIPLDGSLPLRERDGNKFTNNAIMFPLLAEKYRVPGFAIPFYYYLHFVESNQVESRRQPGLLVTYAEYIEELLQDPDFRSDPQKRFEELARLRDLFKKGIVERETVQKIAARIQQVFGTTDEKVRFRSSGNAEDLLEFSGAGLHTSDSACAGDDLDNDPLGPSRCNADQKEERGIARALKNVWGGLWNFRAFEERSYYQIPHTHSRMAILVSQAFTGASEELVNGVAFTGNPSLRGDKRYLVNAQFGDTPVVSPPPGVIAEKDALVMEGGAVGQILRVRSSSLASPGQLVLTDDQLRDIGAVMADLDQRFPIDLGTHARGEVLLDLEFKIDTSGQIRWKDIRPFLTADSAPQARPKFYIKVPPSTTACGVFLEGREPRAEYDLKSTVRFAEGLIPLPTESDAFEGHLFDEVLFGPERKALPPLGPGSFHLDPPSGDGDRTTYRFSFEQEFSMGGDDKLRLELSLLEFETLGGVPLNDTRTLNEEFITSELVLLGYPSWDQRLIVKYSSCLYETLPAWQIEALLEGNISLRLEEKFHPEIAFTGLASLTHGEVFLGGEVRRDMTDYFRLVYSAKRHNEDARYWVVLDPPLSVAGAQLDIHAIELEAPHLGERAFGPARAAYLGVNFEVLSSPKVVSFGKGALGNHTGYFLRGDVDGNKTVNMTDVVKILLYLFQGGEVNQPLDCPDAADTNNDDAVNLSDAVHMLNHLFKSGPAIKDPYPLPGPDPTPDSLGCSR